MKALWAATFVVAVVMTNVLTSSLGLVGWLGVSVTAGTWIAGFTFVARDLAHEAMGARWVACLILIGALVTAAFDPRLALASGTAFLLSEGADMAVYAPLRASGRTRAAVASNLVGALVDTTVFLALAGFPLSLTGVQAAVKVAVSIVAVIVWRSVDLLRQPMHARSETSHV